MSASELKSWGLPLLDRRKNAFPFPLDREVLLEAALPGFGNPSTLLGANLNLLDSGWIVRFNMNKQSSGPIQTFPALAVEYNRRVPTSDSGYGFWLPDAILDDPRLVQWLQDVQVMEHTLEMERYMLCGAFDILHNRPLLREVWPDMYAACGSIHKDLDGGRVTQLQVGLARRRFNKLVGASAPVLIEKIATGLLLPEGTPEVWIEG
jgi:hypothetical protein